MEHASDMALLLVVTVNVIVILATCILNTGTVKHKKREKMTGIIILLSINLFFDVVCQSIFVLSKVAENGKVFILFIPLTGYLLYDTIKDIRKMPK